MGAAPIIIVGDGVTSEVSQLRIETLQKHQPRCRQEATKYLELEGWVQLTLARGSQLSGPKTQGGLNRDPSLMATTVPLLLPPISG